MAFSTPGALQVIAKWLGFASMCAVLGALALWFFVLLPVLNARGAGDRIAHDVSRRIARLAVVAAIILLAVTVLAIFIQITKSTWLSFTATLRPSILRDFLCSTRIGSICLLQQLLTSALVGVLSSTRSDLRTADVLVMIGLVLAANTLLTTSLLSHAAANPIRVPATSPWPACICSRRPSGSEN